MSSAAVAELDADLQYMLGLKPPGVSGSKIQSITLLCVANIQSESILIQKLYTHFKKAPASHKLGVLYVVDSVTRKWTENARNAGQPINSAAQDGTFAAAVNRVQELLPVLMHDIVTNAPGDQKDKIEKLVGIWEKGQTFPLTMLNSFKEKLNASSNNPVAPSYTPPGSPPATLNGTLLQAANPTQSSSAATVAPASASSVLAALGQLASMNQARQAAPPNTASAIPLPLPQNQGQGQNLGSLYNVSNGYNNAAQQAPLLKQTLPFPPHPSVNVPATFAGQAPTNNHTNAYAAAPMALPAASPAPNVAQQQLAQVIQSLSASGMSVEQIHGIMQNLSSVAAPNNTVPSLPFPITQNGQSGQAYSGHTTNGSQNDWGSRPAESREGNFNGMRSPGRFERRRSRSPSPSRAWNARDSPASRRRNDAGFESRSPGRGRDGGWEDRGRGRALDYRQRSPPRRRSPSPERYRGGEKWISSDPNLPHAHIKVLSRTLFVGGVTMPDYELRHIFEPYGKVQTCIVNKEKRHAFVKMFTRADAVQARDGMEKNRSPDSQLRTRWGVGFGPRDCSDYQTGVSIIPIGRLTDADRKWMLTAEYGGTGGKPIESNMVVEEPDIEIGQGVSSKAISRRMQTDKGGNNGPKSNRGRDEDRQGRRGSGDRGVRDDRREDRRDDGQDRDRFSQSSAPPPVPAFGFGGGFPFQFPTLPNGMPMMPPGFVFPGQTPSQPPPPGRS